MRIWVTLSIQQPRCRSKCIITLYTRKSRWCSLMAFTTKWLTIDSEQWSSGSHVWYMVTAENMISCMWDTCWPNISPLTIYASNQRHFCLHVHIVHGSGNATQSSISYIPVRTCTKYSLGLVESIESKVFNLASNGHDICEEHSRRPSGWEKKNSG
jgi:hypothetical protein